MELSRLNPTAAISEIEREDPNEEETIDGSVDRGRETTQKTQNNSQEDLGCLWLSLTILGMIFPILDMGSDIYVALRHFLSDNMVYFGWTLGFIIPSSVITNILSLLWYVESHQNKSAPKVAPAEWILRVFFLMLQLGPVLRYIDTYRFGRRSKKTEDSNQKKKNYKYMAYEREDATLIRLFECFLESAPQMVLQIYIMTDPKFDGKSTTGLVQYVSLGISLAAMSLALVSHQRAMRSSQEKDNSWQASVTQFFSQACLTFSRVLTFGLFASYSLWSFSFFCVIHFSFMTTWIFLMDTNLSQNVFTETISRVLFGVAYIFIYVNLEDGDTRWRRTVFHLITFSENVLLISIWYLGDSARSYATGLVLVIAIVACYISGLMLMMLYYKLCHPSGKVEKIYCFALTDADDRERNARRRN